MFKNVKHFEIIWKTGMTGKHSSYGKMHEIQKIFTDTNIVNTTRGRYVKVQSYIVVVNKMN